MSAPGRLVLALCALHGAILLGVELARSASGLRPYVADVEGPVRFTAANTTLSVGLLWSAALLFAVALHLGRGRSGTDRRETWFLASQVLVLGGLAADDRFMLHEWAGGFLGIQDALVLVAVGVVEVWLLLGPGRARQRPAAQRLTLLAVAAAFGAMVVIDGVVPADLTGRLALEEATKVWGGVGLACFAWQVMDEVALRSRRSAPGAA